MVGQVGDVVAIANKYLPIRHQPISSGYSSSSWVTPTWISVQSCCALVIGIFMETGGQYTEHFSVHCLFVACAVLTDFRLSVIYRNATTLIIFWKNWNIPFQKWCHRYFSLKSLNNIHMTWVKWPFAFSFLVCPWSWWRHVYTRLVEKNVSPSRADLLVFLMSAALCEV